MGSDPKKKNGTTNKKGHTNKKTASKKGTGSKTGSKKRSSSKTTSKKRSSSKTTSKKGISSKTTTKKESTSKTTTKEESTPKTTTKKGRIAEATNKLKSIKNKINIQNAKKGAKKVFTNGKDFLNRHPAVKGALIALASLALVNGAEKIQNPRYQVAQAQNPTANVEEGEYGLIGANGENRPKKGIDAKVKFRQEDGSSARVPYIDVIVLSDSFTEKELEKCDIVYRLKDDADLRDKNKIDKIKAKLKAGTIVIGNALNVDIGYTNVHTDNGMTGKISNDLLEEIMELPKIENKEKDQEKDNENDGKSEVHENDDYYAVNGEVLGIDVNTSAVNLNQFEEMLAGTRKKERVGEITNTKINHVYIKIGGYYAEYEKHTPLWDKKTGEYDKYMNKVVDMVKLCQKYNVEYGFYFYSTAINETEAHDEAKRINEKLEYFKEKGINPPTLPLAIDIETKAVGHYDRQKVLAGNAKKIEESSKARAITFNEVLKENGDYVSVGLYTNQNVTGAVGSEKEKIIDLETLADNISEMKTIPIWWVASLEADSAAKSCDSINNTITPKGKKLHVFCKQIEHDTRVKGSFLVDYSIIYEDDYIELLNSNSKNRKNKSAEQLSSTKSQTKTTMLDIQPKGKTNTTIRGLRPICKTKLYDYTGSHCIGEVDETTQIIGIGLPDKYGRINVVTRDGRKGKVSIDYLESVQEREKDEEKIDLV